MSSGSQKVATYLSMVTDYRIYGTAISIEPIYLKKTGFRQTRTRTHVEKRKVIYLIYVYLPTTYLSII